MRFVSLSLLVFLTACGGTEDQTTSSGSPQHRSSGGSHAHGHHNHDSPESLRPLMRDLRGWMLEMRGAMAAGDSEGTQRHAHAIAVACDDQDVHAVDPEQFGPRFAEIDEQLHAAAREMATAAESGDLSAARARYDAVLDLCVACHEQAPTASHVDLADLAFSESD